MPMGRYSASSSVNSDLANVATGGPSRGVSSSASSSRVGGVAGGGMPTNNGEISSSTSTPTSGASQALGDKVGESFSNLKLFTSSVVKSFSLSAGLFQAAAGGEGSGAGTPTTGPNTTISTPATKTVASKTPVSRSLVTKATPQTLKYTGPGAMMNPLVTSQATAGARQHEITRTSSVVSHCIH